MRTESGLEALNLNMSIEDLVKAKREEILKIAAKHGARNIRIFGSVAREKPIPRVILTFLWNSFPDQLSSASRP